MESNGNFIGFLCCAAQLLVIVFVFVKIKNKQQEKIILRKKMEEKERILQLPSVVPQRILRKYSSCSHCGSNDTNIIRLFFNTEKEVSNIAGGYGIKAGDAYYQEYFSHKVGYGIRCNNCQKYLFTGYLIYSELHMSNDLPFGDNVIITEEKFLKEIENICKRDEDKCDQLLKWEE